MNDVKFKRNRFKFLRILEKSYMNIFYFIRNDVY